MDVMHGEQMTQMAVMGMIQWNVRMAGSLIMTAPVIGCLLKRYHIRGLTGGAVKGA